MECRTHLVMVRIQSEKPERNPFANKIKINSCLIADFFPNKGKAQPGCSNLIGYNLIGEYDFQCHQMK